MGNPLSESSVWNLVSAPYADYVVPGFEPYARKAIAKLGLASGARAIDVACGPGTASILMAKEGIIVDAIDFAPGMLKQCRRRAAEADVEISIQEMDGQRLGFQDDSFDGGLSMFGLMFFPDRHAGLTELHRVLRPGARVAISSWVPAEESQLMRLMRSGIQAMMEGLPAPERKGFPLECPEEIRRELEDAGFDRVEVHRVEGEHPFTDPDTFWAEMLEGAAPVVLLRQAIGEESFRQRERLGHAAFLQALGDDRRVTSKAFIALGSVPL